MKIKGRKEENNVFQTFTQCKVQDQGSGCHFAESSANIFVKFTLSVVGPLTRKEL